MYNLFLDPKLFFPWGCVEVLLMIMKMLHLIQKIRMHFVSVNDLRPFFLSHVNYLLWEEGLLFVFFHYFNYSSHSVCTMLCRKWTTELYVDACERCWTFITTEHTCYFFYINKANLQRSKVKKAAFSLARFEVRPCF